MKYKIVNAKDCLGGDIKDVWEIINILTGKRYGNKFYNTSEEAALNFSLKEIENIIWQKIERFGLLLGTDRFVKELAQSVFDKLLELGFVKLEDGLSCPRCGKIFHDEDVKKSPDDYLICPICFTIQHKKCMGIISEAHIKFENIDIEKIAERVHKAYCEEYKKQKGKDYWTKGDYLKLTEKTKDYDRKTVKAVLNILTDIKFLKAKEG